jgi:glycolate oxidase iron-sulfur subunit
MSATLRTIDYAILQQCMHCGMCLPTCPTYDATKRERNSPRGRISLMRAVADGDLEISHEFADEMSYCLGCLACQTACPAGVDYAELFETARSDIERAGVKWRSAEILARHHPAVPLQASSGTRAAARALRLYQRSGLRSWCGAQGRLVCCRRASGGSSRRRRVWQPSSRTGSLRLAARVSREVSSGAADGLRAGSVYPDVNRDTADVLLANGCVVGRRRSSRAAARCTRTTATRTVRASLPTDDRLAVAGAHDAIISNAGGCGSHPPLRDAARRRSQYAESQGLGLESPRRARVAREIGCRAPKVGPFDSSVTVTYHESCHLAHGQRIVRQPRALLGMLPGLSVVELKESTWCCGSAGIYALSQPEQAERLLQRKVAHVLDTGATIVATGNPGCQMQLAKGLRDSGRAVRVVHPISLVAAAYRREGGAAA